MGLFRTSVVPGFASEFEHILFYRSMSGIVLDDAVLSLPELGIIFLL